MTFTAAELKLLWMSDRVDTREERRLHELYPAMVARQEAVRLRREQRLAKAEERRQEYMAQAANRLAQQAYRRAQQKREAKGKPKQQATGRRQQPPRSTWHRSQVLKLIRERGPTSLTVIEEHFRKAGATRLPREIQEYLERLEQSGDIILDRTTWTGVAVTPGP